MKRWNVVALGVIASLVLAGCEDSSTTEEDAGLRVPSCDGITDLNTIVQMVSEGRATRSERVAALFLWVRDRVAYQLSYSYYQSPQETLNSRRGDCADKAVLLAAMLGRAGESSYFVRFVDEPGNSHFILAMPASGDERGEMARLTGAGSRTQLNISFGGQTLVPVDCTSSGNYIGFIPSQYYHMDSDGHWTSNGPMPIWPSTENPYAHFLLAASPGNSLAPGLDLRAWGVNRCTGCERSHVPAE